ncbi:MAG TPA: NADH-quinone oxidoreductase subunit I [Firmicutes bacterium]|nr:NADH-quinone oxidoreductase subunit I [Bacillota bacterium]
MFGTGLVKGLWITLRSFFRPKITELYPEQRPQLAERVRGPIQLQADGCVACGVCAKACPVSAITFITARDPETKKSRLLKYQVDQGLCINCGFCVEQCPIGGLTHSKEFELACYRREDTIRVLFDRAAEEQRGERSGLSEVSA